MAMGPPFDEACQPAPRPQAVIHADRVVPMGETRARRLSQAGSRPQIAVSHVKPLAGTTPEESIDAVGEEAAPDEVAFP